MAGSKTHIMCFVASPLLSKVVLYMLLTHRCVGISPEVKTKKVSYLSLCAGSLCNSCKLNLCRFNYPYCNLEIVFNVIILLHIMCNEVFNSIGIANKTLLCVLLIFMKISVVLCVFVEFQM